MKLGFSPFVLRVKASQNFEKFASKFKDDAKRQTDLQVILNTLNRMLENGAALERYFRYEGKMSDNVVALPTYRPNFAACNYK